MNASSHPITALILSLTLAMPLIDPFHQTGCIIYLVFRFWQSQLCFSNMFWLICR